MLRSMTNKKSSILAWLAQAPVKCTLYHEAFLKNYSSPFASVQFLSRHLGLGEIRGEIEKIFAHHNNPTRYLSVSTVL